MEALGVYRESIYSHGREGDDALILEETAAALKRYGLRVHLRCTEQIDPETTPTGLVFTMAQGEAGLKALQQWQDQGTPVVNSVSAIRNCRRARTVSLCVTAGVPMPRSWLVATKGSPHPYPLLREERESPSPFQGEGWGEGSTNAPLDFSRGLWVKRADVHATQPDDVVQVWSETELQHVLAGFARRGIARALIQAHCPGRVVKFYGVGPGRFFDCPGLDPAVLDQVARTTATAAQALGLEIFGGDCVVTPEGTLVLLDLNDWPSFAPCRAAAARAIADHLYRKIQGVM